MTRSRQHCGPSIKARELGGDPDQVVVAGESAGGNLAAAVAITCRDRGVPCVAQLLVYPAPGRLSRAPKRSIVPSQLQTFPTAQRRKAARCDRPAMSAVLECGREWTDSKRRIHQHLPGDLRGASRATREFDRPRWSRRA